MNTYTTFNISTEIQTDQNGIIHYKAIVMGNDSLMETFTGLSMRAVLTQAAEFFEAIVNLYCEECAYVTDGQDDSFRSCGLCPTCYDHMMARH